VYGGTTTSTSTSTKNGAVSGASVFVFKPTAPLFGDLLTLVASFGYGLYQVFYKIYAALPSDPEVTSERLYEEIPGEDGILDPDNDLASIQEDAVYPPPFGFHPNLLTSIMGIFTFTLLWIPIPFLHYSGAEIFRLPPNSFTVLAIAGIALSGVVFNAGFMASYRLIVVFFFIILMDDMLSIGFVGNMGSNYSVCWEFANYSLGTYF